jgi:hypothetical protein
MTTAELIAASVAARAAGDSDRAIDLMREAMARPDAGRALASRYVMRPRHAGTYKARFIAGDRQPAR